MTELDRYGIMEVGGVRMVSAEELAKELMEINFFDSDVSEDEALEFVLSAEISGYIRRKEKPSESELQELKRIYNKLVSIDDKYRGFLGMDIASLEYGEISDCD